VHLTRSALRLTHKHATLRLPPALQLNGYVVVAEKLNWLRYFSHFRCVHRGAFFATMKTTAVRKLMPESWGALIQLSTLFTALLHTAIINDSCC
jgi:DNA-directed RNA polymerase beta subunit